MIPHVASYHTTLEDVETSENRKTQNIIQIVDVYFSNPISNGIYSSKYATYEFDH